jgi:hypothetical protein
MKPNPETTTERELEGATTALRRAAQRARLIARRTHTPLVLGKGGRVEKRWLEGEIAALREDPASHGTDLSDAPASKDRPLD